MSNVIGRLAGVDYGARRIGLALGDAESGIASPAAMLPGAGDAAADAANVRRWLDEHDVRMAVVGLPLNMDGTAGPQAEISRRFADALAADGAIRVELWDERLTSFQADQHLAAAGLSRAKRAARRDALAAQVILQSYLDAKRAG